MKPYPKYKDSGVEWIGEVPEGWEVKKLKYCFSFHTGWTPPTTNSDYFIGDNTWITIADMKAKYLDDSVQKLSDEALNELRIKITKKGSLLYSFKLSVGKIAFAGKDLYTNEAILSISPMEKYNLQYYFYTLPECLIKNANENIYGAKILNQYLIKNASLIVPPKPVQKSIAAYLDRKTAQIDNLISTKQKLIELLKEERAAIINQAVTKGLNPDVPMKDSGIEWLGEIPAHWEVKRMKYVARITLGKMLTNVDKGGYHYRPYLRAQNINWEKVNVEDVKKMWFSKDELRQYRLNKNDLLVSEGGEVGRTSIWNEEIEECYIQNSVHKVTMEPTNDPFFFLYTFCLYGEKGVFESVVSRISIAHLTKEKLKEIPFPMPPTDEQRRISKFIRSATTKIDQTISNIAKQIDLLQEFRIALISEVVTGKIDVRDEGLNG